MTTYAGEVVGKRNTSALLVGVQAGTTLLDVNVAISQKNQEKNLPQDSVITLLDI